LSACLKCKGKTPTVRQVVFLSGRPATTIHFHILCNVCQVVAALWSGAARAAACIAPPAAASVFKKIETVATSAGRVYSGCVLGPSGNGSTNLLFCFKHLSRSPYQRCRRYKKTTADLYQIGGGTQGSVRDLIECCVRQITFVSKS
jgi:hypothetical protein